MRPRAATLAVFFVNGAVVGTWIASIPGIKSSLSASATEIGLVLLGAAFGSLLAQQVTGQLLMRRSSRGILVASALVLPWLVPLPVMAPDLATLALALFLFGYVNSTMDVAMNAHGLALETGGGRSILSGLHAGWSLGAFGGALGMATAVALGFGAVAEALMAAGVLWLVVLLASRSLGTGSVRTAGVSGFHRPSRRALPVALLIIPVAFVAGGIADWGGVYLRQGAGSSAEVAAFAFAAYSLGLFLGRSAGDLIKDRIGSVRLLQLGTLLGAAAMTVYLLVGNPYIALLGMVVAGAGLANTMPQLFGAAGRILPSGPSLSAVFTFATLSFMVEPAVMGIVSDAVGIGWAMGLVVLAAIAVAIAVTRVPAAETSPRFAPGGAAELAG